MHILLKYKMRQGTMKNDTDPLVNNYSNMGTRSRQNLPLSTIVIIKHLHRDEKNPSKAMKRLVLELKNNDNIKINSQCLTQKPGTSICFQCLNNQIYAIHENGIYYFVRSLNINPGNIFLTENNSIKVISTSEPPNFIVVNKYNKFIRTLPFEDKGLLYRSGKILIIKSTKDSPIFKLHENNQPVPNNSDFWWDEDYFRIKYFSLDPN